MKKKYINIILLIVVVAIWGSALYKFISGYWAGKEQEEISQSYQGGNTSFKNSFVKDTFALIKIERDPFLGTISRKTVSRSNTVRTPKKQMLPPPSGDIPWPQLKYFGFVEGKASGSKLLLIRINGRLHKLRKGESAEGVSIIGFNNDSVQVSYNEERRYLSK